MATNIEWTQTVNADGSISKGDVWNPTTGCTKISQGCKFCYAEVMHKRLTGMGQEKYKEPFTTVVEHKKELIRDFGKKPKRIFVNSMSDLFHEDVSDKFIIQVFNVIRSWPQHTFIVLTKRAQRLIGVPGLEWPDNLWMGVSVEDERVISRVDYLRVCGAKVKFLSVEPLIGGLGDINLRNINWLIIGGESGRGARSMDCFTLDEVIKNCKRLKIPLFVKQFGTVLAKRLGYVDKKGGDMNEWPEEYRIRQFPAINPQ